MKRFLLVSIPSLLAACTYTDGGEGTKTLFVVASSRFDVGGANGAEMIVEVSKDGAAVSDVLVRLRDDDSDELFELPESAVAGRYSSTVPGYHRRLQLAVQSGSDALEAKLEGPGPHVIESPRAGGVDRSGMGGELDVAWATEDGLRADEVVVSIRNVDAHDIVEERTITDDTGSYDEIPMAVFPPNADNYRLTLTRRNRVDLDGGTSGSTFVVSYGVETTFTLVD